MNKFSYISDKILIIVPHEDDELNLVGGLLAKKNINKEKCYVAFMTNGDYGFLCKTRVSEAKKSLKYLGIPMNNVFFMGYADQSYDGNLHMYNIKSSKNYFKSTKEMEETYCDGDTDYHYKLTNTHNKYNYCSLVKDFILLIENIKPNVIFTIDFDSHPDHRCCSLVFEKAMGIVLKKYQTYTPKVFKGFAYPTAYKGINDFENINVKSTKFETEPFSLSKMQNPYYKWDERVRFPVSKKTISKNLIFNKLYKNLKKHRSQLIIEKSYSIINSDQIFWQRRTDNLGINAKISVSSGNKDLLNDFMLFDCRNVMNGNKKIPPINLISWIPDSTDKEKKIKYEFNSKKNIENIVFYKDLNKNFTIKSIRIILSNGFEKDFKLEKELVNDIVLCQKDIEWLEIKILDSKVSSGFSEIEIFESKNKDKINYIKILNDDDFIYDNHIFDSLNIYI